jgi:hypothetical protein
MALKTAAVVVLLVVFVACFVIGVVAWGYAAFYMIKTLSRFHPDRRWGQFIPVSLFTPWFFTEEGNHYRVKLLKASALFLAMVAGGFAAGLAAQLITGENIFQGGVP